ncbi:hypothetical protein [Nonomuraea fuscirosea]|uniref:hypothetical protein n=1 Tax=Nonomuraea fuscirosea TaxID=1291556 RepID=UPI0034304C5F
MAIRMPAGMKAAMTGLPTSVGVDVATEPVGVTTWTLRPSCSTSGSDHPSFSTLYAILPPAAASSATRCSVAYRWMAIITVTDRSAHNNAATIAVNKVTRVVIEKWLQA